MHFFTRQRHSALQAKPNSKADREATRDWIIQIDLYNAHFKAIMANLPGSARKFAEYDFHDAQLLETHFGKKTLNFLLDTSGCFGISQPRARVSLEGVDDYSQKLPRAGEWWLYSELHLAEKGFSLHILFDKTDFRVSTEQIYAEFFQTS
jgi:hypothetical protein